MRILEFIHDEDHPEVTNIDFWVEENTGFTTRKVRAYEGFQWFDFDSYDLIILHGGAQHLWNKDADPWLYEEVSYIQEAIHNKKPVIGLCLGSQLIAEILGGKVYRAREKEIGWFKIVPRDDYKNHLLLKGLETGFTSFMWHSDHYELPPRCISLGYTEAAPHQIITSSSYPVLGFQFHPEYTKDIVKYFFETYRETEWKGGRYVARKEGFLETLQEMPETYPLFRQLMNNAMKWFSQEFEAFK